MGSLEDGHQKREAQALKRGRIVNKNEEVSVLYLFKCCGHIPHLTYFISKDESLFELKTPACPTAQPMYVKLRPVSLVGR